MEFEALQPVGTTAEHCESFEMLTLEIDIHAGGMAALGIGRDAVS